MKPGGFSCEVCERAFRWKRELAGKRVKCKCGERLTVPEKEPLSKAPPAKPGRTRVSAPSRTASSDIGSDAGSAAFLEALDSLSSTNGSPESTGTTHDTPVSSDPFAKHCPNCHRPVSHNAAVCLNCGTNLRSGKKIRTQRKRAKAEAKTGGVADGITGLKVGAWGLLLQAAGAVLLVVAVILAIAGSLTQDPDAASVGGLTILALGAAGLGVLMMLVGPLLCLAVPVEAGRYRVLGAIGSVVAAVVVPIVISESGVGSGGAAGDPPIAFVLALLASAVLSLVALVCLLYFMQSLAAYLHEERLEDSVQSLMRILSWTIIGNFLTVIPFVGVIIGVVVLLLQVLLIVRYVWLSGQLGLATMRA